MSNFEKNVKNANWFLLILNIVCGDIKKLKDFFVGTFSPLQYGPDDFYIDSNGKKYAVYYYMPYFIILHHFEAKNQHQFKLEWAKYQPGL